MRRDCLDGRVGILIPGVHTGFYIGGGGQLAEVLHRRCLGHLEGLGDSQEWEIATIARRQL